MEVGARIEETSPKIFNRSQRAGFVPEGWTEVYKLQFLFCFFFPPLRKGEAEGLGNADV